MSFEFYFLFENSCSHFYFLNEYNRGKFIQMRDVVNVCDSLLLCFHK
jgi:hypothetical protein